MDELGNEELRKLQLTQLDILKAIRKVCQDNKITFYLVSGTLLGAVRHGGFIPWDDDIDICMPVDSYKRFLEIGQRELGNRFFVQNAMTEKNYYGAFTKVRLNNTTMMPVNHTKYHINHGVWVDIFPLVKVGSEKDFHSKKTALKICNSLLMKDYIEANPEEFMMILGKNRYYALKAFYLVPHWVRESIHRLMLKYIFAAGTRKEYGVVWTTITTHYPKDVFDGPEAKFLPFEGDLFPVPYDYKRYLTLTYGDYMKLPPIEERKAHGSLILDYENGGEKYMEL